VYGVKGVTEIPLVEERAKMALNTLAARNIALTRPSLLTTLNAEATDISLDMADDQQPPKIQEEDSQRKGYPRVQFSSNPDVKVLDDGIHLSTNSGIGNSIHRPSSAQSTASDISTPSSDASAATSPVFKTLASRLSFWSRLSKRTPVSPTGMESEFPVVPEPMSLTEEEEVLDNMMIEGKEEPAQVIENILASTAPPPATSEERHSELETKVVRECIREYTKGDMYFAYNFGIFLHPPFLDHLVDLILL
jgi:hypothetical protein